MSLDRFESSALAFVQSKLGTLDIKTVILDDWCGIRLIYDTADVRRCTNDRQQCRTYLTLGEDKNPQGDFLRTTLVEASGDHTDVTRNRMLNCKTTTHYQSSFVEWLQGRCHTLEEFREELTLVRNFRVVYSAGVSEAELPELERTLKDGIVESARRGMGERRALFDQAVREIFLPW